MLRSMVGQKENLLIPSPGSKNTFWPVLLLGRLFHFLNSTPKMLEAGDEEKRVRLWSSVKQHREWNMKKRESSHDTVQQPDRKIQFWKT